MRLNYDLLFYCYVTSSGLFHFWKKKKRYQECERRDNWTPGPRAPKILSSFLNNLPPYIPFLIIFNTKTSIFVRKELKMFEHITANEIAGYGVGAFLLCSTIYAPKIDSLVAASQRRSVWFHSCLLFYSFLHKWKRKELFVLCW